MTAFFNDLGKTLAQAGQGAVRKARELADAAKYSTQITCEEHTLNGLFAQLGKFSYRTAKGEPVDDAQMAMIITQVDATYAKIANLRIMIERAKENYPCPGCKAEGQMGPFCANCGVKLEDALEKEREERAKKEQEALESMRFCDGCGALLDEKALYCSGCGVKIDRDCDCDCDCDDTPAG